MRVTNKKIFEKRRREIALIAATLFVKQGYLKTSMRNIAEKCGISIGTLYYYIKSKDEILSLFHQITSDELNKFDDENLVSQGHATPKQVLINAIDAMISFINETEDITVFWFQEAKNLNHQQTQLMLKREEYHVSLLKNILKWGCEQGQFTISDINLAAHNIIVVCDMWAFRRWILRKNYTLDQFKQAQTELILAQVKASP